MDARIKEEIKKLKKNLIEYKEYLKEIEKNIQNLKSQNRSQIQAKEKELEELRAKLELCQQEKRKIDKEIREKVKELKGSQLSNVEKQAKINQLLTENSEELEKLDQLLHEERSQYRQIRDKLIGKLCEPCGVCQAKEQNIKNLEKRVLHLQIWAGLILLFAIFNFGLFLYVVLREKGVKKGKKYIK
ncbi:MAG: hypothetical protein MRERC_4c085 [Mycoplasmataceae bacterium RC_NB112A]|nr:MAG: hypothetical protein MRERC_4c085 [Mycoplasmataceae bacterium RC_NB112A]